MNSPETRPPAFEPVPRDPNTFLAVLSMRELGELQHVLRPGVTPNAATPWLSAITAERASRTKDVNALRTYRPPKLEAPEYDAAKGPTGFLQTVRQLNRNAAVVPSKLGSRLPESDSISALTDAISQTLRIDMSRYTPIDGAAQRHFFDTNIEGILLGPTSIANERYDRQKLHVIRGYVPEIELTNAHDFRTRIRLAKLGKAGLAALRTDVEDIAYYSPVPDFYAIHRDQQDEILAAIADEWLQMWHFICDINEGLFKKQFNLAQKPLAYLSLQDLKQAIEQHPLVKPAEICRVFLREPHNFSQAVQLLAEIASKAAQEREAYQRHQRGVEQAKKERRRAIQQAAKTSEKQQAEQEKPIETENMPRIMQLLEEPHVKQDVLHVELGTPVALSETDQIIPTAKLFDEILDKHIELIGRALWENMSTSEKSPKGLRLDRWENIKVGEMLRGRFKGGMRNLFITQEFVTEEYMRRQLSTYDPETTDPQAAVRIVINAEMKPTGKKPEPVILKMLLFIRKGSDDNRADALVKNKNSLRTTGHDVALSLHLDAEAVGRQVEVGARKRPPLASGIPGLGKRRQQSAKKN